MNVGGGDEAVAQQQPAAGGPAQATPAPTPAQRHVIIVGFGLAGRAAVNNVIEQGVSYTVIESNPEVVTRCLPGGLHIIHGDAREPIVLRLAGIARASDVAVTIPDDDAALAVVEQARKLNAKARIIARCTFVSGGMEATRLGADETVIAEQIVATEFGRVVGAALER
jgi:CPA2 family monovalent cation:H+ antiporter-2